MRVGRKGEFEHRVVPAEDSCHLTPSFLPHVGYCKVPSRKATTMTRHNKQQQRNEESERHTSFILLPLLEDEDLHMSMHLLLVVASDSCSPMLLPVLLLIVRQCGKVALANAKSR